MPFDPAALRTAAEAPGWDEPPPPDIYDAELLKAEVFQSKAGADWLRVSWRVLVGRLEGHEWSHIQALERYKPDGSDNEMALAITARILAALGVDIGAIQSVADLPRQLDPLRGSAYSVEVKRNGNFVNTTPKERLATVQSAMPASNGGGGLGQAMTASTDPYPRATGVSDVPEPGPKEYVAKGDIDPETGEPIPFAWEPPPLEHRSTSYNPFD